MRGYDRTWPTAVWAIGVGAALGVTLTAVAVGVEVAPYVEPAAPLHEVVPDGRSAADLQADVEVAEPEPGPRITVTRLAQYSTAELLELLRAGANAVDRRNAAVILGANPEPGRVLGALMIAARSDSAPEVRFKAAESLGRLARPDAAGMLGVVALEDEDLRVREAAVAALGQIASPLSIPTLTTVAWTDESDDVRAMAVLALFAFGDRESLRAIEEIGRTERSHEVRRAIQIGRSMQGR